MRLTAVLLLAVLVAGCSSRPVLYPNDHYNWVGGAQAEADIDGCMALAEQYGTQSSAAGQAATSTVVGSGAGAATGAAVGAVVGSAGRGAATGAVGGAVGGLIRGLFKASEPAPIYKRFVNQCLSDRGYQPIGWD